MNRKGIFTPGQEILIADLVSSYIKLKGILAIIQKFFFRELIKFLDDTFADKINADVKRKLSELADAIFVSDFVKVETLIKVIEKDIEEPITHKNTDSFIPKGIVNLILGASKNWLKRERK
jgi:hypothetical protein